MKHRERLCGKDAYCNADRLCGHVGPLCHYCDQVDHLLSMWKLANPELAGPTQRLRAAAARERKDRGRSQN